LGSLTDLPSNFCVLSQQKCPACVATGRLFSTAKKCVDTTSKSVMKPSQDIPPPLLQKDAVVAVREPTPAADKFASVFGTEPSTAAANLPGAREKQCAPCSVCKARFEGRAPKVTTYCVACWDIFNGKLVCVCSRKREAAESDDSCCSYHTRHPLDVIYTKPDFLDPDKE
jgi:hypothetical protein